jgi:carbon-monoxide dehydrogenase medium subunit
VNVVLEPFRLHEPTTVSEATNILGSFGEDARPYAGGTELLLAMKQGLLRYPHLVNIKPLGLNGLGLEEATGRLRIGATATHRAVERSEIVATRAPMLASMERHVANVRVRAVGTVGGNLCFAEPHSDLATVLLLYDATVTIAGASGRRSVSVRDFLVDAYTTCLRPDELLLEIEVPPLPSGAGASYRKFAFFERPSVGVGAVLLATPDRAAVAVARIAVGCVGPTPFRVAEAEASLTGAALGGRPFERALQAAVNVVSRACDPVDDLYGSAEYKRHLAAVLTERTVTAARDRILEGGRA